MKDIVKIIFDRLFSMGTFACVAVFLFIFLIVKIDEKDRQNVAELKAKVAACYNAGMVLVESDAGPRCAAPANLIAIK